MSTFEEELQKGLREVAQMADPAGEARVLQAVDGAGRSRRRKVVAFMMDWPWRPGWRLVSTVSASSEAKARSGQIRRRVPSLRHPRTERWSVSWNRESSDVPVVKLIELTNSIKLPPELQRSE